MFKSNQIEMIFMYFPLFKYYWGYFIYLNGENFVNSGMVYELRAVHRATEGTL